MLIAALRQMEDHGKALREAAEAQDAEAYKRAKRTIVPDARNVERAMDKLNMAHASGLAVGTVSDRDTAMPQQRLTAARASCFGDSA